jgi:nucleotide-binding universal stress UspA family protein
VPQGPIIIGYDGSAASERAVTDAGVLFGKRKALVVTVWEAGAGFAVVATPTIPPAPIDFRLAIEYEEALYEGARQLAEHGARLAIDAGLDAQSLAVADESSVPESLVRIATECDAACLAVGSHGHRALREVLMGTTTRQVIQHAPCPVLAVRGPDK